MKSWQIKLAIRNCESQIQTNRASIRKAEKNYESLSSFRSDVSGYQVEFVTGNAGKSQALDAVNSISDNCDAAMRYYKGMKNLVDRNGTKIVNVLLERLLYSTRESMRNNLEEISELESANQRLQREIERLNRELKIAEMNEAFEDANK